MLVLSRRAGEAILIEDVVVTLLSVRPDFIEVALQKRSGGKSVVVTLSKGQSVDACYDSRICFVAYRDSKARLGIQAPADIEIRRQEMRNAMP